MSGPLTPQVLNRIQRRVAKKLRRLKVRPIFDRTLLPEGYSVRYKLFNIDGARRIIIAGVVDPKGKTLNTGHAICNPTDEYIEERGMLIAEGRAVKSWWFGSWGNGSFVPNLDYAAEQTMEKETRNAIT